MHSKPKCCGNLAGGSIFGPCDISDQRPLAFHPWRWINRSYNQTLGGHSLVLMSSDFVLSPYTNVLPFFGIVLVGLILIAAWVSVAVSRFVQGGSVEHPHRVPQLYGYTVCLVAVFVALFSFASVVRHTLTLMNPAHVTDPPWAWAEPSVTSLEAFRVSQERMLEMRPPGSPPSASISEDELRRRYEALRADRIIRNQVVARRGLVSSGLTLLLAVGLFVFHWRWLRGKHQVAAPGPAA